MLRRRRTTTQPPRDPAIADAMLNQTLVNAKLTGLQLINAKKLAKRHGSRTVMTNLIQRRLTNDCRSMLRTPGFNASNPGVCMPLTIPLPNVEVARTLKKQQIKKQTAGATASRVREMKEANSSRSEPAKESLFRRIAAGNMTQDDFQELMMQYGDSAFTGSLRSMMNPYNFSRMFAGGNRSTNTSDAGVAAAIVASLVATGKTILTKLGLGLAYGLLVSFALTAYKRIRTLSPKLPQLDWLIELNSDMQQSVVESTQLLAIGFKDGAVGVKNYLQGQSSEKPTETKSTEPPVTKPGLQPKQHETSEGNIAKQTFGDVYRRKSFRGQYYGAPRASEAGEIAQHIIAKYDLTRSSTAGQIINAIKQADIEDYQDRMVAGKYQTSIETNRMVIFSNKLKKMVYEIILQRLNPDSSADVLKLMPTIAANTQDFIANITREEMATEHKHNEYQLPDANALTDIMLSAANTVNTAAQLEMP